jgi:hypothetical protein
LNICEGLERKKCSNGKNVRENKKRTTSGPSLNFAENSCQTGFECSLLS